MTKQGKDCSCVGTPIQTPHPRGDAFTWTSTMGIRNLGQGQQGYTSMIVPSDVSDDDGW